MGNPTRTPSPSRFPPKGREGEGRRGRGTRKGGRHPPLLVQFGPEGEGCSACPRPLPSLGPNWTRRGGRPLSLFSPLPFLPSPSLPLGGNLLGLGVLVGSPPWRTPCGRPPPLLLYIRGQGAPHSTSIVLLAVCGAPSIVYSSGYSVVVLRRSPARITSPPPLPHCHADGTLPRPSARSRV